MLPGDIRLEDDKLLPSARAPSFSADESEQKEKSPEGGWSRRTSATSVNKDSFEKLDSPSSRDSLSVRKASFDRSVKADAGAKLESAKSATGGAAAEHELAKSAAGSDYGGSSDGQFSTRSETVQNVGGINEISKNDEKEEILKSVTKIEESSVSVENLNMDSTDEEDGKERDELLLPAPVSPAARAVSDESLPPPMDSPGPRGVSAYTDLPPSFEDIHRESFAVDPKA